MTCIQKIYGFHGLSYQIIEESLDVTPVTEEERTDGGGKWKIGQCSELNQKPQLNCFVSDAMSSQHFEL